MDQFQRIVTSYRDKGGGLHKSQTKAVAKDIEILLRGLGTPTPSTVVGREFCLPNMVTALANNRLAQEELQKLLSEYAQAKTVMAT